MKKKLIFIFLLALFFNPVTSFSQGFEKGKMSLSAGYGAPNFAGILFKTLKTYTGFSSTYVGPYFGKFEYAISDMVGLGMNYAYTSATIKYDDYYINAVNTEEPYVAELEFSSMSFLGRVNFHFSPAKALDPYLGFGVGYKKSTYKYLDDHSEGSFKSPNPFGMDMTFGVRYFFTENIGIYSEIGIAKGLLQGGISAAF